MNKKILVAICLIFIIVFFTACDKPIKIDSGNTQPYENESINTDIDTDIDTDILSNIEKSDENKYLSIKSPSISVFGMVTHDGERIYYYSTKDAGIYAINTDGSNRTKLLNTKADQLYYYKNKVYFIGSYTICSINTDGTDFKELLDEPSIYGFYIYEDVIYYISKDFSLCSYNITNQEKQIIKDPYVRVNVIYNNKLYYHQNEGLDGNLVEYDMVNKTEKVHEIYTGNYIQFYDNCLYFYNEFGLAKYNLTTNELEKIENVRTDDIDSDIFYVTDKNIFFVGKNINFEKDIYRVDVDGNNLTKITNYKNVVVFCIANDKIFLTDSYEYYKEGETTYQKVIDFEGNELDWDI